MPRVRQGVWYRLSKNVAPFVKCMFSHIALMCFKPLESKLEGVKRRRNVASKAEDAESAASDVLPGQWGVGRENLSDSEATEDVIVNFLWV